MKNDGGFIHKFLKEIEMKSWSVTGSLYYSPLGCENFFKDSSVSTAFPVIMFVVFNGLCSLVSISFQG